MNDCRTIMIFVSTRDHLLMMVRTPLVWLAWLVRIMMENFFGTSYLQIPSRKLRHFPPWGLGNILSTMGYFYFGYHTRHTLLALMRHNPTYTYMHTYVLELFLQEFHSARLLPHSNQEIQPHGHDCLEDNHECLFGQFSLLEEKVQGVDDVQSVLVALDLVM